MPFALTISVLMMTLLTVSSLICIWLKWADHCLHYVRRHIKIKSSSFLFLWQAIKMNENMHWQPITLSFDHHLFCLYERAINGIRQLETEITQQFLLSSYLSSCFVFIHSLAFYDVDFIFTSYAHRQISTATFRLHLIFTNPIYLMVILRS